MSQVMTIEEPLNFEQEKEHKKWMKAMQKKYDSIMKNDMWKLNKLSKSKGLIGSKWLFKSKFNMMVL